MFFKLKKVTWVFLILIIIINTIPINTVGASLEKVLLKKVMDTDYKAIIVRSNGEMYLIEYGVGVISLWLYEGRYIHIYSPGIFAGVGSKIMLLDKDREARIWNSEYIGQESSNNSSITTTPNSSIPQGENALDIIREREEEKKQPSEILVIINGELIDFRNKPIIENNRLLVPFREIGTALGAKIYWDDSTRTASLELGEKRVVLFIDSKSALVDGKLVMMDVPARIINNATYIPLRFVGESLGVSVNWNPDLRRVAISK